MLRNPILMNYPWFLFSPHIFLFGPIHADNEVFFSFNVSCSCLSWLWFVLFLGYTIILLRHLLYLLVSSELCRYYSVFGTLNFSFREFCFLQPHSLKIHILWMKSSLFVFICCHYQYFKEV